MDDFNVSTLHESKNEWGARLLTILTPLLIEGYCSILEEAIQLCNNNNEHEKYLMTFQNLISRIPKWNQTIIDNETKRICDKSGCVYLEELITCVHIVQLKILTSMRVGQKQKKIDIDIPKLNDFLHKAYVNIARKLYQNIYLFEIDIAPLEKQRHNREIEQIVQECILNTVRENIPIETILKVYMDETVEEDVVENIKEEIIDTPVNDLNNNEANNNTNNNTNNLQSAGTPEIENAEINNGENTNLSPDNNQSIKFNNIDLIKDTNNNISEIDSPKDIATLETKMQKPNEDNDDDDFNDKLNISNTSVELDALDIHNMDESVKLNMPDLLDDVEVLP